MIFLRKILRHFKLLLLTVFLLFANMVMAQNSAEAEKLFNNKQYKEAKNIYSSLLKQKPNDPLNNYRYARCCYELNIWDEAIVHFEKSGNKYPLKNRYLGDLYFKTYRFAASIEAYEAYLSTLNNNNDEIAAKIQKKADRAEMALSMLGKMQDIAVIDSFSVDKKDFLKFYKFNKELGALDQEILFDSGNNSLDKIKYTTERKDRVLFSHFEAGKFDILTSYRLLDDWSEPVSVSANINTDANENYPFLMLDGITLYFASDNENNSIGGYDIFITRFMSSVNDYLPPENIGMPFNSIYNDYMLVIDELEGTGWFASDRFQAENKVMIYVFQPNEKVKLFESEDEELIRQYAQLKRFKKIKIEPDSENTEQAFDFVPIEENSINFPIYENLIYAKRTDFQSPQALYLWKNYEEEKRDLSQTKLNLEDMRKKYTNATAEEKRQMSPQIISLEQLIRTKETAIENLQLRIRNEEIKYLQESL